MKVSKQIQGAVAIVSVREAIVSEDLAVLDQAVGECLELGVSRIVLEIRHVPLIDSQGLEKIQNTVTELGRREGDLRIAAPNDVCRDILTATRLDSFIQVLPDTDAAVRSLL